MLWAGDAGNKDRALPDRDGGLVRSELLENPVLEESQELGNSTEEPESTVERQEAVEHQDDGVMPEGPQPERRQEVQADAQNPDNFDWDAYLQAHSMSGPMPSSVRPDDDLPGIEATLTRPETLVDHMMWQVRLSRMSEHEELIAEYIANALDNRGMLQGISVMSLALGATLDVVYGIAGMDAGGAIATAADCGDRAARSSARLG